MKYCRYGSNQDSCILAGLKRHSSFSYDFRKINKGETKSGYRRLGCIYAFNIISGLNVGSLSTMMDISQISKAGSLEL